MNDLSVVIPSRTTANFKASGGAVLRLDPAAKVILVDDDKVGRDLNEDFEKISIVAGKKPFIFSRNVNLGIQAASSDDILILNDDAVLQTPDGFTLLQRAAVDNPEYGVIAAVTNCAGNRNQFPAYKGLREDPRMVCFISVLIPRRTIDTVGLLDEEFTGYGYEDDSYCLRVRRAGLKIGIHDGCFVDHNTLPSTFRSGSYPREMFERNAQIFRQKYGADNHAL